MRMLSVSRYRLGGGAGGPGPGPGPWWCRPLRLQLSDGPSGVEPFVDRVGDDRLARHGGSRTEDGLHGLDAVQVSRDLGGIVAASGLDRSSEFVHRDVADGRVAVR